MPTGVPSPRPERPLGHRLADVAAFVQAPVPDGAASATVTGLAQDSRRVQAGDVYLARPGSRTHGAAHAGQAAAAGAVAAVTDPAGRKRCEAAGLATVVVDDPNAIMGRLSAWIFGDPAAALRLLGVTGTNGKTTTTYLLDAALQRAGRRTGLVGTVESRIAGEMLRSERTTPEAPDLQALFALMRERGVDAAVMEVSSHALALGRVRGTVFEVAGFTNLSQDHLELHGGLEAYYLAKASLFTPGHARSAVINTDDPYGSRLAAEATVPVVTVSPSGRAGADWRVCGQSAAAGGGTSFRIAGPREISFPAEVGLPGAYNVANAALALAMLDAAGFDAEALAPALADAVVPGRMERFESLTGVVAIVDYAHTPAAFEGALTAVRPPTGNRLIVVFGCGGDRDRDKRPPMGEAAARLADLVVITDDNPRFEDAAEIRAAALAGTRQVRLAERAETVEVAGRREAICRALRHAEPGDVVMVLGKGHEQGQEIAGVRYRFDDRAVVRDLLAEEGR